MKSTGNFERIVKFTPAYDKRHKDPNKNYGIGAVRIFFILKGERGAVQILLYTDWYLPSTIKEYKEIGNKYYTPPHHLRREEEFLKCWDVGYHSKKPVYDGHTAMDCDVLGGKCYYDGSSLRGDDDKIVENFLEKGSDFIWKYLEEEYNVIFENKERNWSVNDDETDKTNVKKSR